ncbi:MAG: hypothetical protein ACRDRX_13335 [Pseudonocardiaceae bacterium]
MSTTAEGPELRAAKRLLDLATNHDFAFQRVTPDLRLAAGRASGPRR